MNTDNSTYRNVKNYMHNDLGITKEWIEGIIRDEVSKQVQIRLDGGNHWLSTRLESAVYKWRGSEVVREIARELAGRMTVEVKTKNQ